MPGSAYAIRYSSDSTRSAGDANHRSFSEALAEMSVMARCHPEASMSLWEFNGFLGWRMIATYDVETRTILQTKRCYALDLEYSETA